ncbi:MAG: metallophosphatase family protein, partial [Defluviitaleaceae bacterium]|nr:metallophosphatase family protein [Defluviitaleaceae bacterium]
MKVAVIADIHGNLPALESALADIDRRGADKIICLGDIVGKGPSSKETIALCRQRCEIVLMGNWEYALYDAYLRQKQGQAVDGFRTLWLINDIGAENMEYLGSLPHSAELRLSGRLISLFHAHPRNFNRYFADSPLEQRLELFGRGEPGMKEPADVAVYADIHDAYLQMTE